MCLAKSEMSIGVALHGIILFRHATESFEAKKAKREIERREVQGEKAGN